ncbi:bifunctional diguanylate cyclase/phosphodiesterase [Desulfothermobacter acidiphilus]|uniref:bifunctional diguanylate cyclase/phosphodiesterase n=1 Tax=Desulfothermobacter acidiphilus TaxID=1938353 RepID=UPI003F8C5802
MEKEKVERASSMAYYTEKVETSVRKVLFTTIVVVGLAGALLLLYFARYTRHHQEIFRSEMARELDAEGLSGALVLGNTLGLYRGILHAVSQELADHGPEERDALVERWAQSLKPNLRFYYVRPSDGKVMGSAFPWGQDGRKERWYSQAVERHSLITLSSLRDPVSGDFYVFMATPVYHNNQFLGVTALAVSSASFCQLLSGQCPCRLGQLGVLDGDGYVVAWSGQHHDLVGSQLLDGNSFSDLLVIPHGYGGKWELHLFEVPGWKWRVAVVVDPAAVEAKEREIVLTSLAVGSSTWLLLALFSFSVFTLYFFWQRKQLYFLAAHDFLTGLPNRYSLEMELHGFIASLSGPGSPRSGMLLFLDLDQFKLINDTMGHTAGDRALRTVVERMCRVLPRKRSLARLGGDEFAVLLEDVDVAEAETLAAQLREAVCSSPLLVQGRPFPLGLSVGITAVTEKDTPLQVLARADEALYLAKAEGGNRTVYLPPERREALREGEDWLSRLQDALSHGHFILLYQPMVNLHTGQLCCCEALLRLKTKDGRMLLPHQFLPYAERYGLLPRIDRYVVVRALEYLLDHPGNRVFVNLSSHSIGDRDFIGFVKEQLEAKKLDPTRLGFEISEQAVVRNPIKAKEWLKGLRRVGCLLAIDDFGAGHSSFSWLVELLNDNVLDVIKIAGLFIKDLDTQPAMRALVQAIVTLSRAAHKETVAEWVEREEVLEIVRELGVDWAQGYWFSPPLFQCSQKNLGR